MVWCFKTRVSPYLRGWFDKSVCADIGGGASRKTSNIVGRREHLPCIYGEFFLRAKAHASILKVRTSACLRHWGRYFLDEEGTRPSI